MANILRKGLGFDFKAMGEQSTTIDPIISFTRASTATRISPVTDGLVETVAANVARINGRQELWKAGSKNLISYGGFDGSFTFNDYFNVYNNGPESASYDLVAGRNGGIAYRLSWSTTNTSTKGIYLNSNNSNLWKADGQYYTWSYYAKASGTVIGQTMATAWNHSPDSIITNLNPPLTNDWQRYSFSIKFNIGTTLDVNGFIYAGGSVNGSLYIDDMQLELGSSATDYEANPVVIAPGALLEGAATNKFDYSKGSSGWATDSGTVFTANAGTAPDGSNDAMLFHPVSGTRNGYKMVATPAVGTFVASTWLRAVSGTVTANMVIHDLNFQSYTVKPITITTEWRRFYIPGGTITDLPNWALMALDNVSGDILMWGYQYEAGSIPSSLVIASGSPVTRAADNASIDVSKLWNAQEGTLVVEADLGTTVENTWRTVIDVNDGGATNRFTVVQNNGTLLLHNQSLGVRSGRVCVAFSTIGRCSVNGEAVLVLAPEQKAFTKIDVAQNFAGGEPLNGTLQYFSYHRFAFDDFTLKSSSQLK